MLIVLWAILGGFVGGSLSRLASALAERGGAAAIRGRCPSCGVPVGLLTAAPAIVRPIESCASCGARLREPWPLGEVAGALSFSLLAWRFGTEGSLAIGWPLALYSAFAALLILISLIDLRKRLILDVLSYPAMAVALVVSAFTAGPVISILGGLIAGGLFLLMYILSVVIYHRGDAFGLGDVKLAFLIGLVVGGADAISVVLYGIILGAIVAIAVLAIRRDRKMAVPYGPTLALGCLLVLLVSPTVWR
jgi:leader peptidase (prepilin peptidase) / N-methyltransferase